MSNSFQQLSVLSIDVGIKNLAYCWIVKDPEKGVSLRQWAVIDLTASSLSTPLCSCGKQAYFSCATQTMFYCKIHAKKKHKASNAKLSWKREQLAKQWLEYETLGNAIVEKNAAKKTKGELFAQIIDFEQRSKGDFLHPIKHVVCANKMDMVEIGVALIQEFETHLPSDAYFSHVIVENQIGPNAVRMKYVQGMIVQYFLMTPSRSKMVDIVSPVRKLSKARKGEGNGLTTSGKKSYANRKQAAVELCRNHLEDALFKDSSWKDFFLQYDKQDDLADCFLQGMWYVRNKCNTPK